MKARYDNIDEYIADLQAEIAKNENCATHHYNLGVAYLSKADYVDAEEAFLAAVRNSPHLAEGYIQLGGICMARGDMEGCLRYNEEASNCRAKFAIPQANIGFAHLQMGNVEKAFKALDKALKWDPDLLQARTTLASAYFMTGDYDACIEESMKVIRKEAGFGPAWNNLALAYMEKGEYDKAVEAADKAIATGYDVPEKFRKELDGYRK